MVKRYNECIIRSCGWATAVVVATNAVRVITDYEMKVITDYQGSRFSTFDEL